MAPKKKKGSSSGASEDTTTQEDEVAAVQANHTNSDNVSVDTVADGQLEVDLYDLGIPAEDITAMKRIDTRLEELRKVQQAALEAGTLDQQMVTRAKGKQSILTEAERQEQYNNIKEEELRCLAMQRRLREQRQL